MSAFAAAAPRAFERLSDKAGALPGDVRLFDRNPGPGWVAEDASVPYSSRREGILLANTLGGFQVVGSPFSAGGLDGMSKIGGRVYAWQGQVVAYTDDGEAWTTITTSMTGQTSGGFGGVAVFNGLLIVTAYSYGNSRGEVRTSSDGGQTFTTRVNVGNGTIKGLWEFDGALYICTNVGVYRSTDGVSWSQFVNQLTTDLAATRDYIIASGTGGLYRAPRSDPTSWAQFYSPNSETFQTVFADDDESVWTSYRDVVLKGPPDGGQSTNFGVVARPNAGTGENVLSINRIDGLLAIGNGRQGAVASNLKTTRDLVTFDVAASVNNSSSAEGIRRIYKIGGRVLVGGEGILRGAVATQRGLPLARRPPGRLSAKAYTRL